MSSELNASSWIRDYETTKAGVLNKRTLGTLISPEELRQFQAMVLSLERGLQTMQASPMAYEITISEISRRQVITENLKRMLPLLTVSGSPLVAGRQAAAAAGGGGSAVTDHIPAAGAGGVSRTSEGGRSSLGILNPLQNINAVSDRGLAQRQEQVIKQQDAMIDDIERGVDRLHQRALEIGEETKIHTKIISGLDTHVDSATTGLREEARHVERVRLASRTCCLYLCITVELIIICVMLFVVYQYMGGFPKRDTQALKKDVSG